MRSTINSKFNWRLIVIVVLVPLLTISCGSSTSNPPKNFTIGVLIQGQNLTPVLDGFKSGLAQLGYEEGKTVAYIYDGPTGTVDALKTEAQKLKSQKLDLLLAIGTPPAQIAKDVFADTNIPVLFGPAINPVQLGLVADNRNPGGNMTGIQSPDTVAKALEWLVKLVPDVKRIYVPHAPQDAAAVSSLQSLTDAAKTSGVELVVVSGSTPEELDTITKTIPENIDAVFQLRSGALGGKLTNLVEAAKERHLPLASSNIGSEVVTGVLIAYGPGYFEIGKQMTHLADAILKGTKPSSLPVEMAETYLGINLQTAKAIGFDMPDSIVRQAAQIVRES